MAVRILVPVDGSELSEQVLPAVRRFADQVGACTVRLLLVVDPRSLLGVALMATLDPVSTPRHELAWARRYVNRLAKRLAGPNVEATGSVLVGPPTEKTLERAAEAQADYLFLATHGRSGLGRALLGSLADSQIRRSPVPVVVIHPAPPATVEEEPPLEAREAKNWWACSARATAGRGLPTRRCCAGAKRPRPRCSRA